MLAPSQQESLLPAVEVNQSHCLNEQPTRSLRGIIKGPSGDRWLESDADEQLLLNISFMQKVKVSALLLRTSPSHLSQAPKRIKLFINKSTLGFDEAEDAEPAQEVELTEEHVKGGENGGGGRPVPLRFVRFQAVNSLQIAVLSNQGDEDTTRIDAIDLWGQAGDTFNMKDLKKVEEE